MTDTKMHKCLLTDDELENLRKYQQENDQAKLLKEIRDITQGVYVETQILKVCKIMQNLHGAAIPQGWGDYQPPLMRIVDMARRSEHGLANGASTIEDIINNHRDVLGTLKAQLK
jgi:hypothetical protein